MGGLLLLGPDGRTLSYTPHPDGVPVDQDVRVVVSALRPDFAPPYCRADDSGPDPLDLARTPLADST